MKRFKVPIIIAVLAFSLSTLIWVGLAHAQSFQAGGNGSVAQNKTIDGTLYSASRTIDIAGTVNGDVLCAGQTVTISGSVHGDVLCAAQTIDISGTVDGSIRVVAQSVDVTGTVNRNASIAAQSFITHGSTKILGDLSYAGSSLTLNGSIGRDAVIASNDTTIAAMIGRNLKATTTNLTFTSDARVLGEANYISANDASVNSGAQVSQLTHTTPTKPTRHIAFGTVLGFGLVGFVYELMAALFTVTILILVLPKFFHDVTEEAVKHLGMTVLVGFLSSIVIGVVIIALMVTLIGIPLALLLMVTWLVLVALSLPVAAYYIGSMVLSKAKNPVSVILLGTLILVVLMAIPIAGALIGFVAFWIGSGSLLRYLKQHWPKPNYKL